MRESEKPSDAAKVKVPAKENKRDIKSPRYLRNKLVHFEANDTFEQSATAEDLHKDLFTRFKDADILAQNTGFSEGSWTFLVETKAVAEWSCRTAAGMILDFWSKIPQSRLKSALSHFEDAFHPANLFRTLRVG